MKVAIFGASGLVGRSIRHLLSEKKIEWIGTYNKSSFPNGYFLENTDINSLEHFLKAHNTTHCINCVAERNVDICEKQSTEIFETNCLFATRLTEACKALNIYMIHISTDYVFDGKAPPYSPSSDISPIQAYGKSKAQAEKNIRALYPKACILRVPVLYTQRYTNILETAVTMIGKKVMDRTQDYKEDNFFIRRPVFIDDVVIFLLDLLEKQSSGLFHFYNPKDKLTKYEIASLISKFLKKDISHIEAQDTPTNQAGRPYDTQLTDTQYERLNTQFTSLEEGIQCCFERYKHPILNIYKKPSEPIFFLLDLDGTLINTEKIHYESYKKAFEMNGYIFVSWNEYEKLVSLEEYCKIILGEAYEKVKEHKNKLFYKYDKIEFIPGAEIFLKWLIDMEQNFVVVTNTSKQTVKFLQTKLPLLELVTQWITRDDVSSPKPHPEPYILAKDKFWKGESYCIGVENTVNGYLSLKEVTPIIYMICETKSYVYNKLYTKDIYFNCDWNNFFYNS